MNTIKQACVEFPQPGTQESRSEQARIPLAVYVLGLGIFSMTTSEFMVAGLMPSLSAAFGASVAEIGYLISLYAAGMVIGGPVLTIALLKFPRKKAMLALVGAFVIGQTLGALAPTYATMAVARVITGIVSSAFFGVALSVCAEIVGPQARGRAAAIVVGGLMIATVLGLPLAIFTDQLFGWSASFGLVAALTLLSGIIIAFTVPALPRPPTISLGTELSVFRNRALWAAYSTSGLIIGATFAAFSYFSPIFIEITGFAPETVPLLFILYGAAAITGNIIVGRYADRYTRPILIAGLAALSIILVLFALFAQSPTLTLVAVIALGLVGVPMNPAMITYVMRTSNDRPLVNTIHTAVINMGIVIGSWLGGLGISAGWGLRWPLWVGAIIALVGLITLMMHRKNAATPES